MKPSGVSSREYVEALARKLESQDEGWKNKAEELQQEVLRLRQELLITRATSSARSSTEAAGTRKYSDALSEHSYCTVKYSCPARKSMITLQIIHSNYSNHSKEYLQIFTSVKLMA